MLLGVGVCGGSSFWHKKSGLEPTAGREANWLKLVVELARWAVCGWLLRCLGIMGREGKERKGKRKGKEILVPFDDVSLSTVAI